MNAGDTLALLGPNSQLIFDSSGNLVGIQNPRANGVDFRISPTDPSFTTLTVSGLSALGAVTATTVTSSGAVSIGGDLSVNTGFYTGLGTAANSGYRLYVYNGAAGKTPLRVDGLAASMFVDNGATGDTYLNQGTLHVRTFAGTEIANFSSGAVAVTGTIDSTSHITVGTTNRLGFGTIGNYMGSPDSNYDTITVNPGGTEALRIKSNRMGLGVSPTTWAATNVKALQVASGGFANNGGSGFITNNASYEGGGAYTPTYIGAGAAQMVAFNRGGGNDIQFLTAASGTASTAISWVQGVTINSTGNTVFGADTQVGGNKHQFNESGVRGWGIQATGGQLVISSGDGLGALNASLTGGIVSNGPLDISSASAGQIKFSATQNASADANTLDDYEEGTWTPTDGSGAGLSMTNNNQARYIKVGRIVIASFDTTYPVTASGSGAALGSLPFTSTAGATFGGGLSYSDFGLAVMLGASAGQAIISFYGAVSASAVTNANASGKRFAGSVAYMASA